MTTSKSNASRREFHTAWGKNAVEPPPSAWCPDLLEMGNRCPAQTLDAVLFREFPRPEESTPTRSHVPLCARYFKSKGAAPENAFSPPALSLGRVSEKRIRGCNPADLIGLRERSKARVYCVQVVCSGDLATISSGCKAESKMDRKCKNPM